MRRSFWNAMWVAAALAIVLSACAPTSPTAAPAQPAAPGGASAAPTQAGEAASPGGAGTAPTASAATQPSAGAPTPVPAAKVKRGGTLKSANNQTYPTFDPHISSTDPGGFHMLYDPLISFVMAPGEAAKYELRPALAESWKLLDPKTVEIKLRQGVKFHDGSEWNAEVAKWNLERNMTHKKSVNKENLESIASVQIVDSNTLKLNLKGPSAAIFTNLSDGATLNYMIPKAAMEKLGEEEFGRNPVGSGAMEFSRWVRDDFVEMKAHKSYWKKGADGQPLPYIDVFQDYYRPDPTVTIVELRAGTMDLGMEIDAKDVATIKSAQNLRFIPHPMNQAGYFGFGMASTMEMFKDRNMRLALQHAVDRESLVKALTFGMGKVHYVRRWSPGVVGFDEATAPKLEYSPEKVKQYLAAGGHPNGIDITMQVINRGPEIRMAEVVKQMWDKLGIRTTLDIMERVAWVDKMHSQNYQVTSHRPAAYPDPDLAGRMEGCGAAGNWFNWCNKEFDKCMEEGRSTYDEKERAQIYQRCIKIMVEDAWTGVAYRMPWNFVVSKRVQNFQYGWNHALLQEAWLE